MFLPKEPWLTSLFDVGTLQCLKVLELDFLCFRDGLLGLITDMFLILLSLLFFQSTPALPRGSRRSGEIPVPFLTHLPIPRFVYKLCIVDKYLTLKGPNVSSVKR